MGEGFGRGRVMDFWEVYFRLGFVGFRYILDLLIRRRNWGIEEGNGIWDSD